MKDKILYIIDSYIDNFRDKKMVLTEQQYRLNDFFDKNLAATTIVVAPTSYGKSELIISAIKKSKREKICILVPTKSLLAQTKKRVLDARIDWVQRIVSHPEMHKPDDTTSIYILTQERLTRILNTDKKQSFDMVIVDEAHNLLANDNRSTLLASVIRTLDYRNRNTAFKFLTPFLQDFFNLQVKKASYKSENYRINEYVKSEKIFIADYRSNTSSLQYYDHFLHELIELPNDCVDKLSYIHNHADSKNIIYLNRPKHIQEFALELADSLPDIEYAAIEEAVKEISVSLHEKYLLLHCMKKGVLYHHGSMTDTIRNYVEYLYRQCSEIKYIVSNSTLLEGVNLPIEKMFILSTTIGRGNLNASQFKNLIGRVNRFSDIFDTPSLKSLVKLQPEIHIIGSDKYNRTGANLLSFSEKVMRVTKKTEDKVTNVLLENVAVNEDNEEQYDKVMTRLENLESGITEDYQCPIVTTAVGMKLLENNISEIDVFAKEEDIQAVLNKFKDNNAPISDSNTLMDLIYKAFIYFINPDNTVGRNSLLRLENDKAQTFYAMFLDWKIEKAGLPVMIQRFIKYWEKLPSSTPVFVAGWGDTTKGEGRRPSFTYMHNKEIGEKINLAIVRIKEEEDFFDYVIFRFIDILNELEIIDETYFKLVKYGTTDPIVIAFIKNGFSRGVSELLIKKYMDYVNFRDADTVLVNSKILRAMEKAKESFLQRLEVSLNVIGLINKPHSNV